MMIVSSSIQPFTFFTDGTPNFGDPLPPNQPIPVPPLVPIRSEFVTGDYNADGSVDDLITMCCERRLAHRHFRERRPMETVMELLMRPTMSYGANTIRAGAGSAASSENQSSRPVSEPTSIAPSNSPDESNSRVPERNGPMSAVFLLDKRNGLGRPESTTLLRRRPSSMQLAVDAALEQFPLVADWHDDPSRTLIASDDPESSSVEQLDVINVACSDFSLGSRLRHKLVALRFPKAKSRI